MAGRADETGEELDVKIAKEVFGVSKAAIDGWPWGVPAFSSDRRWSADVIGKMLVHPAREIFDAELERAAKRWGWKKTHDHGGASALLLVLTPDVICQAALRAIHEYGFEERT